MTESWSDWSERPWRVCDACGGAGRFPDDSPAPTPQGPHYGPDIICTACLGTGEIEDDSELIEEEDVYNV